MYIFTFTSSNVHLHLYIFTFTSSPLHLHLHFYLHLYIFIFTFIYSSLTSPSPSSSPSSSLCWDEVRGVLLCRSTEDLLFLDHMTLQASNLVSREQSCIFQPKTPLLQKFPSQDTLLTPPQGKVIERDFPSNENNVLKYSPLHSLIVVTFS